MFQVAQEFHGVLVATTGGGPSRGISCTFEKIQKGEFYFDLPHTIHLTYISSVAKKYTKLDDKVNNKLYKQE